MRNKVSGIILTFAVVGFVLFYRGSDGFSSLGGGSGSTGISQAYVTVEDQGVALTQRDVLNFTGLGITCSDDSGNSETDCVVPHTGLTNVLATDSTSSGFDIQMSAVGDQIRFARVNTAELDARTQSVGIGTVLIPDLTGTIDDFLLEDLIQTITNKTIDGDNNTFVDVKPDQWDNSDSPANGECASYQSNQVEWIACGGASPLGNDLPVDTTSTTSTSDFSGIPGVTFVSSAGAFITTGDIYYQPFQTTEEITINRASFEVTSAGNPSDSCRIGLYNDAGNMQPGDLVADWGQVVNDSLGWKHATVSTTIAAGQYLMSLICDSGPALENFDGKSYLSGGVDTSTTANARFIENMRVSAPTGTQHASGFADPGDEWDTVDLNANYNFGYWIVLRWS